VAIIYDYPECQAALAKMGKNSVGQTISRRFEAFFNGVEIANGYLELIDANEQAMRFERDTEARKRLDRPTLGIDQNFLAALNSGIPACAGVAIGLDRLLMGILGVDSIDQVLAFSWVRC
jgi:lysyl-tRNA synthetase class 2